LKNQCFHEQGLLIFSLKNHFGKQSLLAIFFEESMFPWSWNAWFTNVHEFEE